MTVAGRSLAVASACFLLGGCLVGPDYERPLPATAPTPEYKEMMGFRPMMPRDALDRGPWWTIYGDATLDRLTAQIDVSNQNLKVSEAAYRQAVALIRQSQSGLYPTVGYTGSAQQTGTGAGRGGGISDTTRGQFQFGGTLSWEIDLWGRIRRTIESDSAAAQASAGDLASARLSAQTSLVINYFSLRVSDRRKRFLEESVAAYGRSMTIVRNQVDAGIASRVDLAQAETLYEQTRAQLVSEAIGRAQFEHAVAVLVGRAPAEIGIAPAPLPDSVPTLEAGFPSDLLERRPDIAAAERQMAAANAQIGIAQAAYFPSLTLAASANFLSSIAGALFQVSNVVWAVGPQLAGTLFDGGARAAQVEGARANFDQTVGLYRQTVLIAFQQVEDALVQQRVLREQERVQRLAVAAARDGERLSMNQYAAGTVPYTTVIQTQTAALQAELTLINIRLARFTASANLVSALGGGWRDVDLPPPVPIAGSATSKKLKQASWWPF